MKKYFIILNNQGLSLLQALITLGLLSGVGVMTMNTSQRSAENQKRVRIQADIENAVSIISRVFNSDEMCKLATDSFGGQLKIVPGMSDENDLSLLSIVPANFEVKDRADRVVLGGTTDGLKFNDITINQVAFGPMSAGAGNLQAIDLWVNITREKVDSGVPSGPTGGSLPSEWKKIDNIITAELAGSSIVTCHTDGNSVSEGIESSCLSVKGTFSPPNCNLNTTLMPMVPEAAASPRYAEIHFTNLKSWAYQNLLALNSPTVQRFENLNSPDGPTLTAQDVKINVSNANNNNSAANLNVANEILINPPKEYRCQKGQIGYVVGEKMNCVSANKLSCPNGQRFVRLSTNGAVCVPILGPPNTRRCNDGELKSLRTNSDGSISFNCLAAPPTFTSYTCSFASSDWIAGGACPVINGKCGLGPAASNNETACCVGKPPAATCSAGPPPKIAWECVAAGGWVNNGTCNGNNGSGYCNGTIPQALGAEGACCAAAPLTPCGSAPPPKMANNEYQCFPAGAGWVATGNTCGVKDKLCSNGKGKAGDISCCDSLPASGCKSNVPIAKSPPPKAPPPPPGAMGCAKYTVVDWCKDKCLGYPGTWQIPNNCCSGEKDYLQSNAPCK